MGLDFPPTAIFQLVLKEEVVHKIDNQFFLWLIGMELILHNSSLSCMFWSFTNITSLYIKDRLHHCQFNHYHAIPSITVTFFFLLLFKVESLLRVFRTNTPIQI